MRQTFTYLFALWAFVSIKVHAQTYNWKFQSITEGKNMQAMDTASDGSATLIGYGNTIMRSTDGGSTWLDPGIITNADDFDYQDISFSGDTAFAVAMTNFKVIERTSNDLYAASPILKTTDGGNTWNQVTISAVSDGTTDSLNITLDGNYKVKFMAVECIDASTAYVAAQWTDFENNTHSTVYKTIDGGENWSPLIGDQENHYIVSMIEFKNNLYVAGNKILFKINISTDNVTNLYPIVDEEEDDAMYFWYTTVYNNSELIFPTTADSIWVTNDEGTSFYALPNIKSGYNVYKHDDSTIVVVGSSTKTVATTDTGTTWASCSAGTSLWNAGVINDSLIGLAKNSVFKMALSDIENGNFSWTEQEVESGNGNFKSIASCGEKIFITGMGDAFLESPDNGKNFSTANIPSKKDLISSSIDLDIRGLGHGLDSSGIITTRRYRIIDNEEGDDYYIPGVIFTTNNNWETSSTVNDTLIGHMYGQDPAKNPNAKGCWGQDYYSAECVNDSVFYVYVQWYDTTTSEKISHGRVYKTSDNCKTWDTITIDLESSYITQILFKDNLGYIGGKNIFYKSTDGGATLIDLYPKFSAFTDATIYIQDINQVSEDTLYISTTNAGVFTTYDACETFAQIADLAGCNGMYIIDTNSWMTVGSSSKSLYTNNSGINWENCYPETTIFSRGPIIGDTLFGCAKSGLYKLAISDLDANSVEQEEEEEETSISSALSNNTLKIWQSDKELMIVSEELINSCSLININGTITGTYNINNNEANIDISDFTTGIYIIQTRTSEAISSQKILIR